MGVGGIAYAGSHGAELLEPGWAAPRTVPAFKSWEQRVKRFAAERDTREARLLRVRIEDKGPIAAFHWRGAPDEDRAPVPIDKGQAVRDLVTRARARVALYGGDDATDLDAFSEFDALLAEDGLDAAVRVGVRSEEGPAAIVERADLVVDGVEGFSRVLTALADA